MTRYPEREPFWTMLALMRPIESPDGALSVIGRETEKKEKRMTDCIKKARSGSSGVG